MEELRDQAAEPESQTDYASVGAHVASVLEAATQAAANVRDEAHAEAARIRADAEQDRSKALEDAAETRRRAEVEAAGIVQGAEQAATRQQQEMVEREHALHESVERTERRLRELVGGLRDLADRLDDVVSADSLADWRGEQDEPRTESLDEALKESIQIE